MLITGTSSGIGLDLARLLWQRDYRVVITARKQSLEAFEDEKFSENGRFLIRALDVTNPQEIESLVDEVNESWGGVDILINNAGISYRSVVEDMTVEDEQYQMAVNYLGPMALIRAVLPKMRQRREGRIINVSSVGGMMAMPTMASYSASKFSLEGASEALWYEMKPWGVKVSLIQPGFINSGSFKKVLFSKKRKAQQNSSPYEIYYETMGKFVERFMNKSLSKSEDVAKLIIRTMEETNPRLRVPATLDAWLFHYIRRLLPRRIYHPILYMFLPGIRQWGKK